MIGFAIFSQCAPIFYDEPVKALAEDCVRIHHLFLLVEYIECRWDETVLGLQANLKETSIVKIACQVEATTIRSCGNKRYL